MRWKDKSTDGSSQASQLEVVDEFRSFVKPTWAPELTPFCMNLTGITQVTLILRQYRRADI
jgi:3'-5' exoribonuclease 1